MAVSGFGVEDSRISKGYAGARVITRAPRLRRLQAIDSTKLGFAAMGTGAAAAGGGAALAAKKIRNRDKD